MTLRSQSSADNHFGSSSLPAQSFRSLWLGWTIVAAILLPVLIAIWSIPGFMTQDGPTHLYNAWILTRSFASGSPYRDYFNVQWLPLPNWAGHLALAALLGLVSPWSADRIMISLTLAGFACSLVWLRWRVRGAEGIVGASVLAAILAMNFPWLLGFHSFLLGCCLFPVTLGLWWVGRDQLRPRRLATVSVLLVVGYFGHLVSLGLTLVGLGFLCLFAPAQDSRRGWWHNRLVRLGRTALACLPLIPLGALYLSISRQGGPMRPFWNLRNPSSIGAWSERLGWVDPLTLVSKLTLPFTDHRSWAFVVFTPVAWILTSGSIMLGGLLIRGLQHARSPSSIVCDTEVSSADVSVVDCQRTRQVWLGFGLFLLLAGLLGPDSLGSGHGAYLPQRVELLGLAALVPAIDFKMGKQQGRLAFVCLLIAVLLQTLIVWDYARYSERTAGQIMQARNLVGRNQRLATVLIRIRSRFRCSPLLHADGWLGVGTGNILWSNYEARYYYFPVQFREGIDHPNPQWFEDIARKTDPQPTESAIALWEEILAKHHALIDKVVAWHRDSALDAITEHWYKVMEERGDVRIFAKIPPAPHPPAASRTDSEPVRETPRR